MKFGLCFLFLWITEVANAGGDNLPMGSRSAGMAHASVALYDIWSVYHNQAGLAWMEKPGVGIFHENRFLLPALSSRGAALVYPMQKGTFGLSIASFGFNLYKENKAGLAYGLKLDKKLSAGIQLNYHSMALPENYGKTTAFSIEVGFQARLTDAFTLGIHTYNPNRARLTDLNNERLPSVLRLGINHRFSDKVMVGTEVEKDVDFRPVFKVGVEYHITEILYLRGGISTNPVLVAFGFGLSMKQFRFDGANVFHQTLGNTPQVSLHYAFP